MKQELPIASLLLAAGILLWFSSEDRANSSQNPAQEVTNTTLIQAGSERKQEEPQRDQDDWVSQQQSLQNKRNQVTRESLDSISGKLPSSKPSPQTLPSLATSYLNRSSHPQAVRFLVNTARQTANGPPIGSSIELTAQIFGQSVEASGLYVQAGQGSHKSRLELKFGNEKTSPSIFQMCDGRFVYRLQTLTDQQNFDFVDLKRIQDQAGELPSPFSPTGWVATGELSSMLQHLGSGFNFGLPRTLADGSVAIKGSWNFAALKQILGDQASEVIIQSGAPLTHAADIPSNGAAIIQWSAIPPQLPHAVELIFAIDENMGYFPARIEFVKFERSEKQGLTVTPMVSVTFSPTQVLRELNDRMFVIDSRDIESNDVTDHYLARIEAFEAKRFAERQKTATKR